jgi:hypothetical protein
LQFFCTSRLCKLSKWTSSALRQRLILGMGRFEAFRKLATNALRYREHQHNYSLRCAYDYLTCKGSQRVKTSLPHQAFPPLGISVTSSTILLLLLPIHKNVRIATRAEDMATRVTRAVGCSHARITTPTLSWKLAKVVSLKGIGN